MKAAAAQAHFVSGRLLLRRALRRYLPSHGHDLALSYGANGKPALALIPGSPHFAFNLAHSAGLAVLALAVGADVGIDVERLGVRPRAARLAERYFAPAERDHITAIADADRRSRAFVHCWTAKEAVVKAAGGTLVPVLATVEVDPDPDRPPRLLRLPVELGPIDQWSLLRAAIDPDYLCVVAVRGRGFFRHPPRRSSGLTAGNRAAGS